MTRDQENVKGVEVGIKKKLRSIEYKKRELNGQFEKSFKQLLGDLDSKNKEKTGNEKRDENRKEV